MDINLVVLTGNVGQEPVIHRGGDGDREWAITRLSLATNRKFKKAGEWKTEVVWHTVVLFGRGLGNLAEKYIDKGTRLAVQGRIAVNKWESDSGEKRERMEIHVDQFGGQVNLEGGRGERQEKREPPPSQASAGAHDDFDDDIPF